MNMEFLWAFLKCHFVVMSTVYSGKIILIIKLIICRQGKKRDGCCCCIRLRDDYTESECGKRDLLQEIMDKYFGRVLLSLPGKVNAFV